MKKYAIQAFESMYQGLHGIVDYAVVDSNDFNEVCDYGSEMSRNLIESYGMEPEPDENEDDWTDEVYDEVWAEMIEFSVWEIPDNKGKENYELEELFYNDPDEFISEYCVMLKFEFF